MTWPDLGDHAGGRPFVRCLCMLIVLVGGCATAPQQAVQPVTLSENPKPTPVARPTDPSAAYHFMLGYQAELAQNSELALKEYQAALKADPSAQSVKARLASIHFSLGDVPNALRYAEDVADGPTEDAHILTHMAGILAGGGKSDKALNVLDRAIELDPEVTEAYFSKGLLLLNLKRPAEAEEAMASFERAITVNPAFEPAYLALASMYESRNDKEQAAGVLKRYLQNVNPRNRDIRHQLVRLYIEAKDYPAAKKELEELIADDPTDWDAQLRMALIHGEQKEYSLAIDRLTQILKARPAELKVRDYLGYIYEESKETQKAIDAYTLNIQLEPTFFEGHLHLGVLYYRLKRFPEATEHLGHAIALNPKQPESHIVQGLAYLQLEQYDKSADAFQEGIRHNPKNADLHFNLGTAYDKLNRFDDVVHAMETAIKLDPHHADALNYLGYSYADRGIKIDQALSLTKQAVALKPDNGYYIDSLGWAYYKSGLLTEALTELKRAAALVGDDPVIYEHLGDIYAKQQRFSDAREAWLHALELDPSNNKLMERFREQGLGDPFQEERIQQAQKRVSAQKSSTVPSP